jgi:DNA end-binding protein Ku
MAAQALWSGTISFSLVAIPVSLVKAVDPGHVSFHLLHRKDYSRLSRKMFCPGEGAVVPQDEIIRGYEILPDKYILMTDEELESVSPERSRTIEITQFIDLREVDHIYYDHPYYLVPSKGGEKAYQLLVEVMRRTNKAGLAKFVMAEREYPVALSSRDGALAVTTLHYPDEILPEDDFSSRQGGTISAEEESRMKSSIEAMIEEFNPAKYADKRRKKLIDLLEAKKKGSALVEAPVAEAEEGDGPPDLVAALEESMRKMKAH